MAGSAYDTNEEDGSYTSDSGGESGGGGGGKGAGAAYDISPATARALASSSNQNAPTIFNFSSPGSWFGGTEQTSKPTSSATATTKSAPGASPAPGFPKDFGGTGGGPAPALGMGGSPWFMISAVVGILSLLFLIFHRK